MTVYELRSSDDAVTLAYSDKAEYTRQSELTGKKVDLTRWSPPAVRIVRDGLGGEDSDFALLATEPAFSARAVQILGDLLQKSGQLLPLLSADGEFYHWNVTTIIDALDQEASELQRFSDGGVMMVDRWAFRSDQLKEVTAFKIPQLPGAFTFVTDIFIDRFRGAGLTGLHICPVWSAP